MMSDNIGKIGWKVEDASIGDYADYTMMSPADGEAIAISI